MTKILGLCTALMLMMAVPTTAQTADSLAAAEVAAADTTLAATDSLTAGADDLQAIADDEAPSFHQMLKTKSIDGNAGFMSLVALALVLGLAFCIERIIYLGLSEVDAKRLMTDIKDKVEGGDIDGDRELCTTTRGPVQPSAHRDSRAWQSLWRTSSAHSWLMAACRPPSSSAAARG